jgi:membrane protein DedA with SNARE-associated domain
VLRGLTAVTLGALIGLPKNLGYIAVFVFVGVESSGIPVPGETALIAGGVAASQHQLGIALVVVVAAAGAIVGDNIGYLIGRKLGRRLLLRPGRTLARREDALARGERLFARHGPKAVFFGRWIAGLRIWASWLAGMTHMRWRSFLFYNALGGIAWATAVGLVAYAVGDAAAKLIENVGLGIAGAVVALIVIAAFVFHRRSRGGDSEQRPPDAAAAEPESPPAG